MTFAGASKIFIILILLASLSSNAQEIADLNKTKWISGSVDCTKNTDPPIQLVQYNNNTWILRQNKCVNDEAPFMFLFLGRKQALLMDDGATSGEARFPLRATVDSLLKVWESTIHKQVGLIVAHTHSHGDHTAGDGQFETRPNTTVVGLKLQDIQSFFKLGNWPRQNGKINIGDRILDIVPIPGHHTTCIAVYDQQTRILLSGDSFYPGRLYIKDWFSFKASTQRLTDFATSHQISYILGNHVEMTNTPGKDYPTGATYQPDEHILPLKIETLTELNRALIKLGDKHLREIHNDFIIFPVN